MALEPVLSQRRTLPWAAIPTPDPAAGDLKLALDDGIEFLGPERIVATGRFKAAGIPKTVEESFLQQCILLTLLARMAGILLQDSSSGDRPSGEPVLCRANSKVRRPISIGEEIRFEARILKALGNTVAVIGLASIAEEVRVESEMYFRLPALPRS